LVLPFEFVKTARNFSPSSDRAVARCFSPSRGRQASQEVQNMFVSFLSEGWKAYVIIKVRITFFTTPRTDAVTVKVPALPFASSVGAVA